MSKDSKRSKNNGPANPHKDCSKKENYNRHVFVEPGAKIDLVDDLKHQYETANSESGTHNQKSRFWAKVTAVATILYLFVTCGIFWVTKKATETSVESLHSTQRASLIFEEMPGMDINNFGGESLYRIDIGIENVGNTQAQSIKDRVSCVAPKGGLPDTLPDVEGKYCGTSWIAKGLNVIPAHSKGPRTQYVYVKPEILEEFERENVGPFPNRIGEPVAPTRGLYFYGWITYRDVFDGTDEHLTEFCRELMTFKQTGPHTASVQWGPMPIQEEIHNAACC